MTYITSLNQLEESLTNDLPNFSLENGQLQADLDEPYINQSVSQGVFVLDPYNELTSTDIATLGEGVVFQQHEALLFQYGSTQQVSYTLVGLEQVNRDELTERLSDVKGFLPLLITIVSLLLYSGLLGVAFLGVTILAFVALLFRGKRKNIQYRHMWLITAHALTLPVIAFSWLDVFVGGIPSFVMVLTTMAIIILAIQSIPIPKRKANE